MIKTKTKDIMLLSALCLKLIFIWLYCWIYLDLRWEFLCVPLTIVIAWRCHEFDGKKFAFITGGIIGGTSTLALMKVITEIRMDMSVGIITGTYGGLSEKTYLRVNHFFIG
ncbi:MAG: hypothetical protein GY795_25185 [Desulfobacterales bacterium]|nr:hypothetical protein [Desulfobacterales bacterium]